MNWKEKAVIRMELLMSMVFMLILFWMPAWVAATTEDATFKAEYSEYGQVFRCLCIMLWKGEYMDSNTLYGDFK